MRRSVHQGANAQHTAAYRVQQKALFRDKIIGKLEAQNKSEVAREQAIAAQSEADAFDDMPALDDDDEEDEDE